MEPPREKILGLEQMLDTLHSRAGLFSRVRSEHGGMTSLRYFTTWYSSFKLTTAFMRMTQE